MARARLLVGGLSITLLLTGAAAAQAASHRVATSPAAARAYWTPERMRTAIPADRALEGPAPAAKPGGGGGGGGGGGSTTSAFTDIKVDLSLLGTQPVSTNGRIFFTDGAWNYSCSGTAVTSANQSVVLTAGHCVNPGDGSGRFYDTNWVFAPEYNNGNAPVGKWPAVALDTTSAWSATGDFSYDVGAATVAKTGGQLLDAVVGSRDVDFNIANRHQNYTLHGYPAEQKFDGQRLWVSETAYQYDDPNSTDIGVPTDFNGGSSGGAWVEGTGYQNASAKIASVNSFTYRSLKNVMFGPYLTSNTPADDAGDVLARAGAVSPG